MGAPLRIVLPHVLDIAAAATFRAALIDSPGQDVIVLGDAVQSIGHAALLVVLSAQRAVMASGRKFILLRPSTVLADRIAAAEAQSRLESTTGHGDLHPRREPYAEPPLKVASGRSSAITP